MCGYAAAYAHSFCMLFCVERHVDKPLHTKQYANKNAMLFYFNGKLHIGNHSDHIKVFVYHLTPFERWYFVYLSDVSQARVHRLVCS
jgi:hypothetical protein